VDDKPSLIWNTEQGFGVTRSAQKRDWDSDDNTVDEGRGARKKSKHKAASLEADGGNEDEGQTSKKIENLINKVAEKETELMLRQSRESESKKKPKKESIMEE